MASLYFAEKNTAWYLPIKLFPQSSSPTEWIASPTIATGDFKRVGYDSTGAVTLASGNLATTPTTSPSSSGWVLLSLSSTEMNNDIVCIDWKDASGAEWASGGLTIMTTADNVDDLMTVTDPAASVTAGVTLADGAITAVKIASDAITAAKIASNAIAAAKIATDALQAIADAVLARSRGNVDNTADEDSLYELIGAILDGSTATGSLVIKKTDGTTTFNTRTLDTDPAAEPIVGISG